MSRKTKTDPAELQAAIQFSEQLQDPALWMRKADELLSAARLLEPEIQARWSETRIEAGLVTQTSARPNVSGAHFLLVGFAIENFFKAVVAHRNSDKLKHRLCRSIPPELNGHNLLALAKRAGFKLSLSDQDLVARVQRNSTWAGRYPVPSGPNGAAAFQRYSDGQSYFTAFFGPSDVGRALEFVGRLRAFVLSETTHGAA